MTRRHITRAIAALVCFATVSTAGCAFQGANSLPLPGVQGRGASAVEYHVQIANVGSLEPNSPVLLDDVPVGSIRSIRVRNWHAEVTVSVRGDTVVPANAVATVGQTSLLGSMHLALDPPVGQAPRGRLASGSTLPLDESSTYPSTEQTLASLSAVVNGGGLGQIGDVIHNVADGLSGHEQQARAVLEGFNDLIGVFDRQSENVVAAIGALNRLSGVFADQRDVLTSALADIPPALDVLIRERPQLVTALNEFRRFSDTATGLVQDTQADLVTNLQNLDPTLSALADVGPEIDSALAYATVLPFGQNIIDRGIRGDYMNLFVILDLTKNRAKRTFLSGTRFGDPYLPLVPVPGDRGYDRFYSNDPLYTPLLIPVAGQNAPPTPQTGGN